MKFTTLAGLSCWCSTAIVLILLSLPVSLWASPLLQIDDQHSATGTVTDSSGKPLGGVNIIVSGKRQGTISDFDGTYTLTVTTQDTLVFSYIGFKTVKIPVNGQDVIDAKLEEDVTILEEVEVNAGYYTVTEKERTGNISRITAKDIETQPVSNVMAAAIGRMPGVHIQQQTGVPGGHFTIRIRGQNSLRADGNEPLYIIDGVPFPSTPVGASYINTLITGGGNPLSGISPSDIESIAVLKDADATAIYGSRGANGVVLITTKKGKTGKTRIELNLSQSIGRVNTALKLLNTEEYLEMRHEAFANDGILPNTSNAPDLLLWEQDRYTDWQKELIGNASYTTNGQLSLSGGHKNTQFLIRGGHYQETPVFPGNYRYQRSSGHAQITHTSTNRKFTTRLSVNYTGNTNNLPTDDPTQSALILPPNAPEAFDQEGKLNWVGTSFANPFARFKRKYEARTEQLVSNAQWSYELFSGLTAKISLGYTSIQVNDKRIIPRSSINPASQVTSGSSVFSTNHHKSWIVEPQLHYQKEIGHGRLSLLAGATFQESLREGMQVYADGFGSDALLENLGAATNTVTSSSYNQYRYQAVFGRIHYNWKEKYLVNLTGRRDGSSRFGPGKQFANFGAVGVAWIFSNEKWVREHLSFLSFGKLRGSYGTTGSDQIGDYNFLDTWSTTAPYQGNSGLTSSRLYNVDFGWETNKKTEAGLELGFLQDRIFLTASYYHNRSSNKPLWIQNP